MQYTRSVADPGNTLYVDVRVTAHPQKNFWDSGKNSRGVVRRRETFKRGLVGTFKRIACRVTILLSRRTPAKAPPDRNSTAGPKISRGGAEKRVDRTTNYYRCQL